MSQSTEHSLRWKTASVLLLIIGFIALINTPWLTWLFFGLVYILALSEAMPLFKVSESSTYIYGVVLWIIAPFYPNPTDLIFALLIIKGAILSYQRKLDIRTIFPLLYPSASLIFFWILYQSYGMLSLLWILVIVALTDVGAYYSGRKFGKTPFSPTSPKKTLEGVFGGVALGTLGGFALMVGHFNMGFGAIFIALITSIASVFGDLFESYLKREAGVKDSGTILPGHGGVLDRIDGYLFAVPALYILLNFFVGA